PARENRGGAWQQLSEPTRARRRKRVHIERAFLAHERREQPRIHTELIGLGFDGRAIGPGPDSAHDAYVARGLTRRLPAEPNGGRSVAAQTESLAPCEDRIEILRRTRQHDAHFGLCFRVQAREQERVDAREAGGDGGGYGWRRGWFRKRERAEPCLLARAHSVVAERVFACQRDPQDAGSARVAARCRQFAEPEPRRGSLRSGRVDFHLIEACRAVGLARLFGVRSEAEPCQRRAPVGWILPDQFAVPARGAVPVVTA